jgi:hypothetical protein
VLGGKIKKGCHSLVIREGFTEEAAAALDLKDSWALHEQRKRGYHKSRKGRS